MAKSKRVAGSAISTTPDKVKLTGLQAQRLAQLTGTEASKIEGRDIAELSEALKWQIDPINFLFQRVCGQVVRWDPASGLYQPVPFATVHVMDTDCDFLGYFPEGVKLGWLYPIFCHEEQIAEVVTDECGKFCVWVPRFDIDWVVRWRLERYCFPEVLVRPNLGDLLQQAGVLPTPIPGPDPGPIELRNAGLSLDRLAAITGRETASRLLLAEQAATLGGNRSVLQGLLDQPAYQTRVPPPTSPKLAELQQHLQKHGVKGLRDFVRGATGRDYKFDPNRYIGPFPLWKCEWILTEELVPILEVPDITFWVTQDTDGDGAQETIYSDGWFQIGWQSGPLSDVILHAAPNARINGNCQVPPVGDCTQPEILFAGLMPVTSAYLDTSAGPTRGYAVRPNPPHADGVVRASVFPPAVTPDTPANAPFMGTVQLYGCNQFKGGSYYRLLYSFNGAPAVPFTNLDWYVDPWPGPGAPLHVVPDAQGWYPILATPDAWFPQNELLDWPTSAFPDGLYDVTLQIGDAGKNPIFTTPAAVPFRLDNSAPKPLITSLAWRVLPFGTWHVFPNLICPIVERPTGSDIEFSVTYQVSAEHLLKTSLIDSGCGGGTMLPSPEPSSLPYMHWHTSSADNFVSQTATFTLPGSALPGCYGFSLNGYSRAFNPAGGDPSDPQAHDWYIDAAWLNWSQYNVSVAVVNV
ncbi:hypothetical protein GCM10011611_32240 [Aliidongia dinghuensis]|uniref:Uncharacterized protein n=1 Tax=Aliidongia dinghuensis TaxID=1867774 RepID=A0A8J3E4F5_9PROT|nr:hypothetical protein [Aliidongia dinghuensis]GGF23695.1 hypothetical protein GCM10011611_32240 [Aliidongia dinghuensis]